MHGEVTAKDGKLQIAVLDKDMKPVKVETQSLTATGGTREKPVKLEITKSEGGFTITPPKNGEWLIIQLEDRESAKINHYRPPKAPPPARFETLQRGH